MARLADAVRSDGGADQVITTPMAPVLVLPRVFEPEFCTQVIRLWEKGDHKDSGVSSRYGNVGVADLARRSHGDQSGNQAARQWLEHLAKSYQFPVDRTNRRPGQHRTITRERLALGPK